VVKGATLDCSPRSIGFGGQHAAGIALVLAASHCDTAIDIRLLFMIACKALKLRAADVRQ
jgi:hypothetical protein